ncbi:MAG: DUF2721 domain-containing protein [Bacteroidales bacterium]|jgi:hypothetical protein|nr:DUF2721 domain-containing protein [Bacteroidales bacterium]
MNPNSAQLINSMLVPGILIVAASILLFSTNSKYSMVVDRIRFLREERGNIIKHPRTNKEDVKRRDRIELQLSHLIHRISMVRITIVSYSSSLLLFAVSCVLLAVRSNFDINAYYWLMISFFFGGLLAIVNGVVFSVIEMFKGYRIVHIEMLEINQDMNITE